MSLDCRDYAFSQKSNTRKLVEITVFYAKDLQTVPDCEMKL